MADRRVKTAVIPGPAGRLEVRVDLPPAPAQFLAVVGHPHPQHGGTMQSNVIVAASRAIARGGGISLRFNFRGVGLSDGAFDGGAGELEDYLAAIRWLRREEGAEMPVLAAGFSFGSLRAFEAACAGSAERVLLIAPPFGSPHPAGVPRRCAAPAALLLAERDEVAPRSADAPLRARFDDLRVVEIVAGASHLFSGRLDALAEAVGRALRRLEAPRPRAG